MDDEVLMGVMNGVTNRAKHFEPLADRETSFLTVAIDRYAIDVLHDEKWSTILGLSPVEETRNVRMLQRCQNLSLVSKPREDFPGVHTGAKKFDGHSLAEFAIRPRGKIDRPHPAPTDEFLKLVASDSVADSRPGR
jgi:hypothetical protein